MIGSNFTRDEWRWVLLTAVAAGAAKLAEKLVEQVVERVSKEFDAPKADDMPVQESR